MFGRSFDQGSARMPNHGETGGQIRGEGRVETPEQLPTELVEEYKLCQQKAAGLTDNIWKSALIFGAGSVAGIAILSRKDTIPDDLKPWLFIVLILFAIGILIAWHRLARRWWSIEQVMFRRMEHIERQSQLRANLYVAHLDNKRVKFVKKQEEGTHDQPFLDPSFLEDLGRLQSNYEVRGIQPMMRFVIETNIAVWIAFAIFALAPFIPNTVVLDGPTVLRLVVVLGFSVWFLVRLWIQWRKM
jgi:hypothetical protein